MGNAVMVSVTMTMVVIKAVAVEMAKGTRKTAVMMMMLTMMMNVNMNLFSVVSYRWDSICIRRRSCVCALRSRFSVLRINYKRQPWEVLCSIQHVSNT